MILEQWAKDWNISNLAIQDFKQRIGIMYTDLKPNENLISESGVQSRIRLEASKKGYRLWRNNVGATYTKNGDFIRYGLANDSSVVNKQIKSADLIGIRPVKITSDLIGITIGQFVSREIKKSDWRYTENDREKAQLQWAELILSLGGDACFATGEGTL